MPIFVYKIAVDCAASTWVCCRIGAGVYGLWTPTSTVKCGEDKGRKRDLREHFNKLVKGQTRDELLNRIAALNGTETALMFFDLLGLLREWIRRGDDYIEAAHPRVILGVEHVEKTMIPELLREPAKMRMLKGMLANLNNDIWLARSATYPDALLRHERGYPPEMGEIACFIDKALGLRAHAVKIGAAKWADDAIVSTASKPAVDTRRERPLKSSIQVDI